MWGEGNWPTKYGRLYTREAALKACPPGWHLATYCGWRGWWDAFVAGYHELKAHSLRREDDATIKLMLWAALHPFGMYTPNYEYGWADWGMFWTVTLTPHKLAWAYTFKYGNDTGGQTKQYDWRTRDPKAFLACRCVKDK